MFKSISHKIRNLSIFLTGRKCYTSFVCIILKPCYRLLHFTHFVSRSQKCRQEYPLHTRWGSICKVTEKYLFVMPSLSIIESNGNQLYALKIAKYSFFEKHISSLIYQGLYIRFQIVPSYRRLMSLCLVVEYIQEINLMKCQQQQKKNVFIHFKWSYLIKIDFGETISKC